MVYLQAKVLWVALCARCVVMLAVFIQSRYGTHTRSYIGKRPNTKTKHRHQTSRLLYQFYRLKWYHSILKLLKWHLTSIPKCSCWSLLRRLVKQWLHLSSPKCTNALNALLHLIAWICSKSTRHHIMEIKFISVSCVASLPFDPLIWLFMSSGHTIV